MFQNRDEINKTFSGVIDVITGMGSSRSILEQIEKIDKLKIEIKIKYLLWQYWGKTDRNKEKVKHCLLFCLPDCTTVGLSPLSLPLSLFTKFLSWFLFFFIYIHISIYRSPFLSFHISPLYIPIFLFFSPYLFQFTTALNICKLSIIRLARKKYTL